MNLLLDPVFTVNGERTLSLPQLFASSARGEIKSFKRLRAHQRTAWHMFRVQLAALALRQNDLNEPPLDSDHWVELLRSLTSDFGDDPWYLTIADRCRPAFLQPPDPGGLKWKRVFTPDALDMLITARNHDLKRAVAANATHEDWVLALVSLQTSEGYSGRDHHGIARMSNVYSSRPFLGLAKTSDTGNLDISAWWRRDLSVLLRHQLDDTVLTRRGPALLWCLPWKEGDEFPVRQMDPWAIEVCRRVRLAEEGKRVIAQEAGSKKSRIDAKAFKGVLGDAWAPVSLTQKHAEVLHLRDRNFDYHLIHELFFSGNWQIPIAAQVQEHEEVGEMILIAEALSHGQSKTFGLKTRFIPLPRRARGLFRTNLQRLADVAAIQIQEIQAGDGALREAVALYSAGGDYTKVDKSCRRRATEARSRLDRVADAAFFDHLWIRAVENDTDEETDRPAGSDFRALLVLAVRSELMRAFRSIPCASLHAPRAKARARSRLEAGLHKAGLIGQAQEVATDA